MVIRETNCNLEMSTLNSDALSGTQHICAAVEVKSFHPALQKVMSSAPTTCSAGCPTETVRAVILSLDDSYLKTFPGIVRMVQIVCSLICLVFLTSSGGHNSDYLLLPVSGHLRVLIFTCVAGLLLSVFIIVLKVTQTIAILSVNWTLCDLILYSALSALFLISSSLTASAIVDYKIKDHLSDWTTQQLTGSVVFGYVCMLAYAMTSALAIKQCYSKVPLFVQKFQLSQQSSNSTFVEQLEP